MVAKMVSILIIALIVFSAWFVYSDNRFERISPIINTKSTIYYNNKKPLSVSIADNIMLKSYKLLLDNKLIATKELASNRFNIIIPTPIKNIKQNKLEIIVNDISRWNFLIGNQTKKQVEIIADDILPNVEILANSYGITQGGSALVVFKATDANMKEIYITTPYGKFKVTPYRKSGYYASLISWPFSEDKFDAKIVAFDKAGNSIATHVPLYIKNKKYATSYIQATDVLIDGKIAAIASKDSRLVDMTNKLEKFEGVNEGIRAENEHLISSLGVIIANDMITDWKILPFYPLKNGAKVASYGDLRHYYYDTKTKAIISTSDHVGIDLASNEEAPIISSNNGKIVYSSDNGLYGKMPMIDHGLGLYTLYGHCSKIVKSKGSIVKAGDVIANSGTSGLALGDHLHFGILVQGNEVAPEEWMDSNWIKLNIDDVFAKANMLIK
jgi:murein DD-endopeptidase MepM/ murein hydrolase activator NlpD